MEMEITVEEVKEISTSELLDGLLSDINGISSDDSKARLRRYGDNEIFPGEQNNLRKFFKLFLGAHSRG